MDMNFKDVDLEKSYELYDRGPYTVRIKSIEDVVASSGNPQLRIKTEILSPAAKGGKQLTDHITLVAACDWKLGKFIAGCGIDVKKLPSMKTESGQFRQLLTKLINRTTVWIVEQQTGKDGNLRNVIVDYQVDPAAKPVLEDDVPEFLEPGEKEKWGEEGK